MNRLICITGIDGAGKSTLVNNIATKISPVYIASIWDIMNSATTLFSTKKDIDNYLCALTADSRVLFLAHALKYSLDKALESGKEKILLNSYYYKYFAAELALGASEKLVLSLIKTFPQPDITIYLDISIEEAAERKKIISRYESGLIMYPAKDNFIAFQKTALNKWNYFEKINWHTINTSAPPVQVLNETVKLIERL